MSEERWRAGFNLRHLPGSSFIADEAAEPIGPVRSHHKHGVASALMARPLAAVGMEYVLVGVDPENSSGAYGVYEDRGFVKIRREVMVPRTA